MEIPNDVQNIIVRKLDIDSRRKIGCYTKLNVPDTLKDKLAQLHRKHRRVPESHLACVGLGPLCDLWPGGMKEPLYNIIRFFRPDGTLHEERVDHVCLPTDADEFYFSCFITHQEDYFIE
jgi:hypothetical protein